MTGDIERDRRGTQLGNQSPQSDGGERPYGAGGIMCIMDIPKCGLHTKTTTKTQHFYMNKRCAYFDQGLFYIYRFLEFVFWANDYASDIEICIDNQCMYI